NYPVTASELQDSYVRVNSSGNYVIAEDNNFTVRVFVATPAGAITELALTGAVPTGVSGLTLDQSGNYVLTDWRGGVITRITPDGVCSTLLRPAFSQLSGIAWDPVKAVFIFADRGANVLYSADNDGGNLNTVYSGPPLSAPVDVISPFHAPPAVRMTSPTNDAIFVPPANIQLTGQANVIAGSIATIEFFASGATLGTV